MIKFNITDKPAKGFDHLLVSASSLQVGEVFAFAGSVESVIKGEPILKDNCSYYMAITAYLDGDIIILQLGNHSDLHKELDRAETLSELIDQDMFTYIDPSEKVLPVELTVSKIEASV